MKMAQTRTLGLVAAALLVGTAAVGCGSDDKGSSSSSSSSASSSTSSAESSSAASDTSSAAASPSAQASGDYTKLLGSMLSFVDALAFQTIEQRLARRLLVDAKGAAVVEKTHQQLAADIGSVREIVSRQLGVWEKKGWVGNGRGNVRILDRGALASRRAAVDA